MLADFIVGGPRDIPMPVLSVTWHKPLDCFAVRGVLVFALLQVISHIFSNYTYLIYVILSENLCNLVRAIASADFFFYLCSKKLINVNIARL